MLTPTDLECRFDGEIPPDMAAQARPDMVRQARDMLAVFEHRLREAKRGGDLKQIIEATRWVRNGQDRLTLVLEARARQRGAVA